LTSQGEQAAAVQPVLPSKTDSRLRPVEVARVPVARAAPAAKHGKSGSRGWFVTLLLAFAVSYGLVSYFKADLIDFFGNRSPSPLPASSR
jgi:hypothetical protein